MKEIKFPQPDEVLTEKPSLRKYLRYLLFFGPGAIIASVTIGQGQLILGPQIGAWADFKLLWLITINVGSYVIAYLGCRYTLLTGIGMMDAFSVKIKKGLLNWTFISIMLIFVPLFTGTIVTTLGQTVHWIVGGRGHYLAWGITFCLFAAVLALVGRYKLVEYTQAIFVAILAIGAIVSILMIGGFNPLEILPNFFLIGNTPSYPDWMYTNFPTEASKPIPLIMLGYLGTLTVTIVTLVSYSGWTKVKKWGIFRDKKDPKRFSAEMFEYFKREGKVEYLPTDKKEVEKSRLLLKPAIVDLAIAFIIVSIASSAYMIAGAYLLGPQPDGTYRLPSDINLLKEQAIIFSNIASWLKPLYQISIFFALFGTVYGGFEAVSRMLYETTKSVSRRVERMSYQKFMTYLVVYLICTGVPIAILMYYGLSVILVLSITLLFTGVVGVIIYGIGVIYITQTTLPEKYKLSKPVLLLSILSIFLLTVPMFSFIFAQ
ncbi:MAG TPA: hypothetical protein ENG74_03780 [Thermoplasmatales archaeon]|nr:hypothetical protein [Thermoplasmatales archaeon]